MRRALIILITLVIVGVAGVWAYRNFFAQATEQPLQEREEHVLEKGTLSAMVNATGTILPEKQTTLSFTSPGRVAEVPAKEGQVVNEGDLLARLETTDQEFAIAQAELALATAQAQLLRIQDPPSQHDIAAAEAALESAKASYRKLVAGPSQEEIRVARTNLDQAQAVLDQAQAAYDQVADRPEVAMLPQALQLAQATVAYQAAQASFDLAMRRPSAAELAAAQSAIAQAGRHLPGCKKGCRTKTSLLLNSR